MSDFHKDPVPRQTEPNTQVFDQWVTVHLERAKKSFEAVKEMISYLEGKEKKAKEREVEVKKINQAHWFMKFQKGVTDLFKKQFFPLNKETLEVIAELKTKCSARKDKILAAVKQGLIYQQQSAEIRKFFFMTQFAEAYSADAVEGLDTFLLKVKEKYKIVVSKEKNIKGTLDHYLKEKEEAKNLSAAEYKEFKHHWESLANNISHDD